MANTLLSGLNTLSGFVSSEAGQNLSNSLNVFGAYNTMQQGYAMKADALKVNLSALASSEADALTAYQINSLHEQMSLAEGLEALRINRDAVISEQRAQLAARGMSNSRTALEFMNDTISSAERAATNIRQESQARRRVEELGLQSTLNQIRAQQHASQLQQ